jgi:hypothetical protein
MEIIEKVPLKQLTGGTSGGTPDGNNLKSTLETINRGYVGGGTPDGNN